MRFDFITQSRLPLMWCLIAFILTFCITRAIVRYIRATAEDTAPKKWWQPRNLSLGGGIIDLTLSSNLLTMTDAADALADLDASIAQVNSALGALGSQAKQIEAHNGFVSKLMDNLEMGIGNLVDADLAKESARLTALQVQQQLGVQALSIANQAPQVILSLFRG